MNNKIYQIYKLVHPVTDDVFYVGKTLTHLEVRLNNHLNFHDSNVSIYIRTLIENNIIPKIEFIKFEENKFDERDLIREYSKKYKLYNVNHNKTIFYKEKDNRLEILILENQKFLRYNLTINNITEIAFRIFKSVKTVENYLDEKVGKNGKSKAVDLLTMSAICEIGLEILSKRGIVKKLSQP